MEQKKLLPRPAPGASEKEWTAWVEQNESTGQPRTVDTAWDSSSWLSGRLLGCSKLQWCAGCFVGMPMLVLLLFGATVVADRLPFLRSARSLNLETDFPLMSNRMTASGTGCTVLRIWHRQVERAVGTDPDLQTALLRCYDQYIAEFGWKGGPFNGKPDVQAGLLISRKDYGCYGGGTGYGEHCDRLGGWNPGQYGEAGTGDGLKTFTSRTVSQAWEVVRGNSECDSQEDAEYTANASKARFQPPGFEEYQVDAILPCRVPARSVDEVPSLYDCPSPNYNQLCARLHNLPQIEIDDALARVPPAIIIGDHVC